MTKELYIDHSDLRKYRTELPNIIYELGLSPYSLLIYTYIKRKAGGSSSGSCYESSANISKKLGISKSSFKKFRKELESPHPLLADKPLLILEESYDEKKGSLPTKIYIVDIWQDNFTFFRTQVDCKKAHYESIKTPKGGVATRPGGGRHTATKKELIRRKN